MMRLIRFFLKGLPLILTAAAFTGCNHTRQVVPVEIDTDKIYQPLEANDADIPDRMSFGPDSVPGFIFEEDFTTKDNDIYVFFENFTVLDINPGITGSLIEFIEQQMEEYGFAGKNDSIAEPDFMMLREEGVSYKDAMEKVIDALQKRFDTQLDTIQSYGSPFNLTFQIYPVYLDKKLITFRTYSYAYTGGAHGMTVNYLITFNLETGKKMTLNDLVKPESLYVIREEVAAQMAYSYPIYENITTVDQYIDSLNVWLDHFDSSKVEEPVTLRNFPLEDPALVKEGLAFVYQMYELTPGSDGCPIVVLPYKDIKGMIKD